MTDIPDWVASYIGLPWLTDGRDRAGVDCWGLFLLILQEKFNIEVPHYEQIGFRIGEEELLANFMKEKLPEQWRPLKLGEEQCGDGILLRLRGQPIHIGCVVAEGWMVHVEEGINSTIEQFTRPRWQNRIVGIYRYDSASRDH